MSLWLFSFLASPLLYKLYRSARQNTTTTTTATTHQEAQNNHENEQNEMNFTTIDHDHQQKTEHELTLKSAVVEEQPHGSISMNNHHHHHMNDELDHTVEIELPQSVISNNNKKNNKNHSYEASAGIIWMHGQNAPISYDTPGGELPYLYEQCNVISTLIKNRNQL